MLKLLVASLACASAATLGPRPALRKTLALRGGVDEKTVLLIQAAGAGAFGSEFLLSDWASTRYWDDAKPTTAWKQLSEAFGIGLLSIAYQSYRIATTEPESITAYGKASTYAWIAWVLMHFKWQSEGTLISSGKYKGQLGGGIACAAVCALSVATFLL